MNISTPFVTPKPGDKAGAPGRVSYDRALERRTG